MSLQAIYLHPLLRLDSLHHISSSHCTSTNTLPAEPLACDAVLFWSKCRVRRLCTTQTLNTLSPSSVSVKSALLCLHSLISLSPSWFFLLFHLLSGSRPLHHPPPPPIPLTLYISSALHLWAESLLLHPSASPFDIIQHTERKAPTG